MRLRLLVLAIVLFASLSSWADIHYSFEVKLSPEKGHVDVKARLRFPTAQNNVRFFLNRGLEIRNASDNITRIGSVGDRVVYRWRSTHPLNSFQLFYSGSIERPMSEPTAIGPQGVALFSSDAWFPYIENEKMTFELTVKTPLKWSVLSHDVREWEVKVANQIRTHWHSESPQEDIYLMSNKWHQYEEEFEGYTGRVYLLKDEPKLAKKLLKATDQYIQLYSKQIGPYPYGQMATVENYWETGYGMPSFTLLGSRVIRFPFLTYSSFPHEILHNWWGNGVYINWEEGNWAEGLTSYMADHALQEQRGSDDSYRRTALLNFSVFTKSGKDFPLKDFRSRHDKASSAVGYSKGLMFFHMLRQQLGDSAFYKGLRHFYKNNLYRAASYDDLKRSFETVTRSSLTDFFQQWTERTGAPQLAITSVQQSKQKDGQFRVTLKVEQAHKGAPYFLRVPIEVTNSNDQTSTIYFHTNSSVEMAQTFPNRIKSISIDPHYDVFRYLYPEEIPESVTKVFGVDDTTLIILPRDSQRSSKELLGWADSLKAHFSKGVKVLWDDQVTEASLLRNPAWILGLKNKWTPLLAKKLLSMGYKIQRDAVLYQGKNYPFADHSFFATAASGKHHLVWSATPDSHTLARSAAKIPHYGKYSYLIFKGERNVLKGEWPVFTSPLRHQF